MYQSTLRIKLLIAALIPALIFTFGVPLPTAAAVSTSIVNPKQTYTYTILTKDVKKLADNYPELISYRSIGKSEYGRDIWSLDLGKGEAVVMLNGSHHAREWITTTLLMVMTEHYAAAYQAGKSWNGLPVRELLNRVTFRIVPMVNPDGVTLQQQGLSAFPKKDHKALIAMNGGRTDFKRWKANGKGIDLNRQYPADWPNIRNKQAGPHYMNYQGKAPLQAAEAIIMAEETLRTNPEIALAYHSSGEIVYWHFHTKPEHEARDRAIASLYASMTGYRLVAPAKNPSGGGYTDWFIQTFGRPGMTPELARPAGETHVPLTEWDRIWKQHANTGYMLAEEGYRLWMEQQRVDKAEDGSLARLVQDEQSYRWPLLRSTRLDVLSAGTYPVLRTKGDWTEVKTNNGARWISSARLLRGTAEEQAETLALIESSDLRILLTPKAGIYASPFHRSTTGIRFSEQSVSIMERWEGWLLIPTWRGPLWLKESEISYIRNEPKAEDAIEIEQDSV